MFKLYINDWYSFLYIIHYIYIPDLITISPDYKLSNSGNYAHLLSRVEPIADSFHYCHYSLVGESNTN